MNTFKITFESFVKNNTKQYASIKFILKYTKKGGDMKSNNMTL